MKIGILGFPLINANKGCEALTYSFLEVLSEILPDEDIEIHAFNIKINKLMESQFPKIRFISVPAKIKNFSVFKEFKKCDLIFDVTAGDGFSDIYFKKLVFRTTLMKECVILSKTPLVLMPQTYGPFNSASIRRFALHTIKKSARVYSRDKKSAELIQKYIKKDVLEVTDLAFMLPYTKSVPANKDAVNIGLNVSGLLWKGGFHKENQFGLALDYKTYIYNVINLLCEKNYCVHLIPHVIESETDHIDGDYNVCKQLCEELKEKNINVICAPAFNSPVEAKNYISGMDAFIGARMHSTIAAFSANVPVIPFSYSRKFEGLFETLNYPYIVHGCQDNIETAVSNTIKWIENRHQLQDRITEEMENLNQRLTVFKQDLKDLLMNGRKQ